MIRASCHCGSICLEVATAPAEVTECNCSVCRRNGVLWAYYPPSQVRLVPAGAAMDTYMWDDKAITFHRCPTCGCVSHWAATDPGRGRMGVNARLLDPDVVVSARVRHLDGARPEERLDLAVLRNGCGVTFVTSRFKHFGMIVPLRWRGGSRREGFGMFSIPASCDVALQALYGAAVGLMPGSALLLNAGGRIVFCNATGEALLRQGDGITVTAHGAMRITAAIPAEGQALAARIANVLAAATGGDAAPAAPLRLSRPSGRAPLLVLAAPLPFALAGREFSEAARALVLIIDPAASVSAAAQALGRAVGFTPAEARAAALIGGGMTVPGAAAALGLSPSTLKTQLTRCFEKVGVHSQVELARVLTALPSPAHPCKAGQSVAAA